MTVKTFKTFEDWSKEPAGMKYPEHGETDSGKTISCCEGSLFYDADGNLTGVEIMTGGGRKYMRIEEFAGYYRRLLTAAAYWYFRYKSTPGNGKPYLECGGSRMENEHVEANCAALVFKTADGFECGALLIYRSEDAYTSPGDECSEYSGSDPQYFCVDEFYAKPDCSSCSGLRCLGNSIPGASLLEEVCTDMFVYFETEY